MIRFDTQQVLEHFLNHIRECKAKGLKEIKISTKELDDVGFVIYMLMSERMSKLVNSLLENNGDEEETVIQDGGSW